MNTYYIRTIDPETLLSLAVQIGLLRITDTGEHVMADPHAGIWDVVGEIHRPTGRILDIGGLPVPETAPQADADGNVYWHANLLLYNDSLGEIARAAYARAPSDELGAALASIPRYFVADGDGNPVAPNRPVRVFG